MHNINDIVVIGAGPAGLTCAIYAARSNLKPIVITGNTPGGQLVNTDMIENYPGFKSIAGSELMMNIISQAEDIGTTMLFEKVVKIEKTTNNLFQIALSSEEIILSKTIVISTGAYHKHLDIPGEKEFTNKGVSWCATCDGPMFKNKIVAVVGGGNTALMEALFLSNFANKVYLIHRRNSFRATQIMQKRVLDNSKIEILWDSQVNQIKGDKKVSSIIINQEKELSIDGLFIAIGTSPVSDFAQNIVKCDEEGYIIAHETETSCKGIFAAGDVVSNSLKQAIFAAGQGALAATKVESFLGVR